MQRLINRLQSGQMPCNTDENEAVMDRFPVFTVCKGPKCLNFHNSTFRTVLSLCLLICINFFQKEVLSAEQLVYCQCNPLLGLQTIRQICSSITTITETEQGQQTMFLGFDLTSLLCAWINVTGCCWKATTLDVKSCVTALQRSFIHINSFGQDLEEVILKTVNFE